MSILKVGDRVVVLKVPGIIGTEREGKIGVVISLVMSSIYGSPLYLVSIYGSDDYGKTGVWCECRKATSLDEVLE